MAGRKLIVEVIGDTSSLEKAFGRVEKRSNKMGRALKVGAGAALGGLAVAAKIGYDELADMQLQTAQTAAALKSTGGVANVTAKQIDDLSQSILNKTGIDDEAVKASENMLLTFTNVRNEVGKGNDVFNQATQAVADMATRMNNGAIPSAEQLSTTSIRLGKALNDPIKGVGALARVGVQFTADQKKQIKALVDSGKTMEAQKLILAELTKEFGGSAKAAGETLPGQLKKSQEQFKNMTAQLEVALIPAVTQFAAAVSKASAFLAKHQTFAKVLIGTIAALSVSVFAISGAFKVYTAATRAATLANVLFGTSARGAAGGANVARLSLIGKAGLVGAVGVAAFALTTMILKVTGLDKKLKTLGASAFDAAAKLGIVNDPLAKFEGKAAPTGGQARSLRAQAARLQAQGLSPADAAARIASRHPGFAAPDLAAIVNRPLVVQTTVNLDGKKVATNTTRHQQRTKRRNPPQKRGVAPGTAAG